MFFYTNRVYCYYTDFDKFAKNLVSETFPMKFLTKDFVTPKRNQFKESNFFLRQENKLKLHRLLNRSI